MAQAERARGFPVRVLWLRKSCQIGYNENLKIQLKENEVDEKSLPNLGKSLECDSTSLTSFSQINEYTKSG
ncbi:MAG: hypothetical protein EAZ25_09765 [Oscillatoriales cyanobacterium]|nr:MAG: hypothetical protein EAZ94_09035 [Oscillatoriales cyanobacterium]TAG66930.1 MAG: hypothetical protein EAZ25_09765 [Oscillatoriales cyanobacterium]